MIDKESETITKDIKSKADKAYLLFLAGKMSFKDTITAQNKALVALNVRIAELQKEKENTKD